MLVFLLLMAAIQVVAVPIEKAADADQGWHRREKNLRAQPA
jgi:hypothetical protein